MSIAGLRVSKKPADPKSLGEASLWIDVRTPGEFREMHIPGSRNLPLGDLETVLPRLKAEAAGRHIALICASGRRAGIAWNKLFEAGIDNCWVLEGGVTAWVGRGHHTNRGQKGLSLERQVRIVTGATVVAGSALAAWLSPWWAALPAIMGLGLLHAGLTDHCLMAPMLVRLPWNRSVSWCS